jgi:peptide-methionine (R)-S-oxide reductase
MPTKVRKTEQEWKTELTDEQYEVLRRKGTERPFANAYNDCEEPGVYHCAACGAQLFSSEEKFHSGSGWPSFTAPIADDAVALQADRSLLMKRTEVLCARCDSHLGHVFDDGPAPTGQRYCMNSVSLNLDKDAGGG